MPGTLSAVQILKTGTWTGSQGPTKFTIQDLDSIVASFSALGSKLGLKPHLKLGHTDAQKFFGQRNGFPSLGEVYRVWRDGDVLFADFVNVPEALLDLVKKRRYTQVSVELYPKYEYEGQQFVNVLVGVALLGAELPAVKGLKDLADALYKELATEFSEQGKLEFTMPAENQTQTQTQTQAQNDTTEAMLQRLAAVEAENKALREAAENNRLSAAREKISAAVEAAISSGKLLPKQKDLAIALGEAVLGGVKIKFGETEKLPVDLYAEFITGLGKFVELAEKGVPAPKPGDTAGETAGQTVDKLARKLVSDGKAKDYSEALSAVISTLDPDTKQRYVNGD